MNLTDPRLKAIWVGREGQRHIIKDFDLFGGLHCETSAVAKVLSYNGVSLSEEMLLGVGCGIGFIYWYMKRMTAPLIGGRGGRSEDLMENIARAIDGTIARITTGSQRRAHGMLMERLAGGQPTVVFADIAFLPYMALYYPKIISPLFLRGVGGQAY